MSNGWKDDALSQGFRSIASTCWYRIIENGRIVFLLVSALPFKCVFLTVLFLLFI